MEKHIFEDKICEEKMRNSNLELFRIISMICIIAHHYVVNSGLLYCVSGSSLNDIGILIFGWGGKTGINCFMMITGYFMCAKKIGLDNRNNIKKYLLKLFKLLMEVEFYSILIYFIFVVFGYESFFIDEFINTIFPFTYIKDGFTSCFFLFYLLIPFLCKFVQSLSEKEHRYLLFALLLIYTIMPSLMIEVVFNYVTWFSVLFVLSSYIRLHGEDSAVFAPGILDSKKVWGKWMVVMLLLSWGSIAAIQIDVLQLGVKEYRYFFVSDCNKILALTTSVCAFLFFKNIKIKHNKFINTIAASSFGVLTIHANSDSMRQWLWRDIFDNAGHYDNTFPYAFFVVAIVFCICTVIDIVRIYCLEKPLFRYIERKWVR
mgnify:CR=1 FL=1